MEKIIDQFQVSVVKVLREFGIVGLVTYIGSLIILLGFLREKDLTRQLIFGVAGLLLLVIATFIAYFRIKTQRDREQGLIDMAKNTGNRLAEQLGKNMTNEQVVSITQTIWQNQKDLITTIIQANSEDKK
jgi:di/tricarboxylate transporter